MSRRLLDYEGNKVTRTPLLSLRRLAFPAFFALTLTLGLAGPLWAATGNVSNLSLTASEGPNITKDFPSAQGFTTGSHSGGYTLQSVTLRLNTSSLTALNPDLALYSVSSGDPNASLASLSNTGDTVRNLGTYTFACSSGCQLDANTSYFIVLSTNSPRAFTWTQNNSGNETNTPANAGWSIADDAKYQNGSGGSWLSEGAVKLMTESWATPALTASSVKATSATLGIANYSGDWYYKRTSPSAGQCSSAVSTATTSLSGLDSGTSYTFKAYSDVACATEIASETFSTVWTNRACPHYRRLLERVKSELHPERRALLISANDIGVNPVIVQRILRAALAPDVLG